MISKDKQYRTRDGREVRIYATDGGGNNCLVHGAIKDYYGWSAALWTENGECYWCSSSFGDGPPTPNFYLIEVKPRHKRTVWLNIYAGSSHGSYYDSKLDADADASAKHQRWPRIACIKVDLDFEEGEGL